MDSFFTILIFSLVLLYYSMSVTKAENLYDVSKYGAAGNGQKDDSQAFIKAWNAACNTLDGVPTMLIPVGTYLLTQIEFGGPCKSKNVNVKVLGKLIAPSKDNWKGNLESWLTFREVPGLAIYGSGTIDGQGASWWKDGKDERRPTALHIVNCPNVNLSGLTHINSPRSHISVTGCQDAEIFNLKITAPYDSPNTDGIDIATSKNIKIHDLTIGTGDDCIALNDKSSFIDITNVQCGPGHGISVGSLGKNRSHQTVENVYVSNCTFSETTNGVRIKTWQGGSGYATNITFDYITFRNAENPIIIDQKYNPYVMSSYDEDSVQVNNISYSHIRGTSKSQNAVVFNCASSKCTNIQMKNISIVGYNSSQQPQADCTNVEGSTSNVTPTVPCLSNDHA